ncbi:hypothetical protein MBLNU230_g1972t1 [Neophaeotheca triangularis]
MSIPPFKDLPLNKSGPHHNAWGLYGAHDELGTLNRQTDALVAKAATSEIRTGARISLNWPLDAQGDAPFFGRRAFHKHVYQKPPRVVNDDEWRFNTQSSSQWDGLRHFGYQKEAVFYNGVTLADIHGEGCAHGESGSTVNGVGAWSEKGIVGRGVLLDYWRWLVGKGGEGKHGAFETGSIGVEDLKAVAEAQGTEIRFGDVLIVRSGYMVAYYKMSREEVETARAKVPLTFTGLEQSEDMLEFLWSNFSAAAGDHPSFECWPSQKDYYLHEVMLAGWGMPIGELFDLEKLSEHCAKVGRWSFFVASEPTNVPGGVASPPNILAIF